MASGAMGGKFAAPPRPVPRRDGRRPRRRPAPGPVRPDRDEAAFEALVARHGPMVLATCRAVLQARARRRRRLPGHVLGPGQRGPFGPRRRCPGRMAAPRGLSRGRAGERRVAAAAPREAEAAAMATLHATHTEPRTRNRLDRPRRARPPARSPAAAGGPLRPGGPDLRAGGPPAALDRADAAAPADQGPATAAGSVDSARRHRGGVRGRPGRGDGRRTGGGPGGAGSRGGRRSDGRSELDGGRRADNHHHQEHAHDQAEDRLGGRCWPRSH